MDTYDTTSMDGVGGTILHRISSRDMEFIELMIITYK